MNNKSRGPRPQGRKRVGTATIANSSRIRTGKRKTTTDKRPSALTTEKRPRQGEARARLAMGKSLMDKSSAGGSARGQGNRAKTARQPDRLPRATKGEGMLNARPAPLRNGPRPMRSARNGQNPVTPSAMDNSGKQRLAKILAAAGVAARRACEEYILDGRVTVDGRVITDLAFRADPIQQKIAFDGETVKQEPKVYWWFNKPAGILCTNRDPQGRKTVFDLMPRLGKHVYCVGRLDEESTGLLLLTNDGPLAFRLTHPRFGVSKSYLVLAAGTISGETMQKMREGVWLSDGKVRVQRVERIRSQGQATWLRVVLREGHNREIRRLFARLGHKVMRLQRIAIGPLKIRKLSVGHSRPATGDEVSLLRAVATRAPKTPKETPAPVAVGHQTPAKPSSKREHRPSNRSGQPQRTPLKRRARTIVDE